MIFIPLYSESGRRCFLSPLIIKSALPSTAHSRIRLSGPYLNVLILCWGKTKVRISMSDFNDCFTSLSAHLNFFINTCCNSARITGEEIIFICLRAARSRISSGLPPKSSAETNIFVSRQTLISVDVFEEFIFRFKSEFFSSFFTHFAYFLPITLKFPVFIPI